MKVPFESPVSLKTIIPSKVEFRFLEPLDVPTIETEDDKIDFSFNKNCDKLGDIGYAASLTCSAYFKGHYSATVSMIAIFTPNEGAKQYEIDSICKYDIYGILLPNVRSLMLSITSYPGIAPAMIPAINVADMVNYIDNVHNENEIKDVMDHHRKISIDKASKDVVDLIEDTFIKPGRWLKIHDFSHVCRRIHAMLTGGVPDEQVMYNEWPNLLDKLVTEACLKVEELTGTPSNLYDITVQKMEDGCWYGTFYIANTSPHEWKPELDTEKE